ncbi:helicase RepA family protein [Alteromonas stellipolaris]|uniref:AAA family ATPase n=1 Tax=Alteromonas stellipolaris TaxID=233316 RepID=UPI0021178B62|nr:AAA family ATPase [Alteromonas stellipolaris]MCQ8849042.1 helicase RepA family protein [Alteromonas stellipolaris]
MSILNKNASLIAGTTSKATPINDLGGNINQQHEYNGNDGENAKHDSFLALLCSGFGQYHSLKHKTNPKPYSTISINEIESLMQNPEDVPKKRAQWFIPTNFKSRDVIELRANAQYFALWADIDEPKGQTFVEMFSKACSTLPFKCYGYTSKSATTDTQKARLIYPLDYPVSGNDFEVLQKILNDKLEAAGIIPDRKTEVANQICYLPNKGVFYDFMENPFDPLISLDELGEEYHNELRAQEAQQAEIDKRLTQSLNKAKERVASGTLSPIDAYNDNYRVTDLLELYGGKVKGERAISPLSESGNAQMRIVDNKLLSHHGSDMENELGKLTQGGKARLIDSFDLFKFFECGNNQNTAIKKAGDMFTTASGASITQQNQRNYMESQSTDPQAIEAVKNMFDTEQKQKFDFSKFSLNGSSHTMKAQMLDDTFILEGIAIQGQATVLYAKPNSGKTLLTLFLLREGAEKGNFKPEDVFYINADDNYKGLVTKLEIAERYKFNMVAPGFNDFNVNEFAQYIAYMIQADECSGKVIILDTLKKFTNIMDKKVSSDFGKIMRGFVTKGGTMIMLAHTNKNRDNDGKVVFSGTSDIVDDVDCAYTIDVTEQNDITKTVLFENIKSRGDVEQDIAFSYANKVTQADGGYLALLDSVSRVSEADAEEAKKQRAISHRLEANEHIIEVVQEVLASESMQKTELINQVHELGGFSKAKARKAIEEHTGTDWNKGHRWRVDTTMKEKNVKYYKLLHSCSDLINFNPYSKAKALE